MIENKKEYSIDKNIVNKKEDKYLSFRNKDDNKEKNIINDRSDINIINNN